MKTKPSHLILRILTSVIVALLLTSTVSCSKSDFSWPPFGKSGEPSLEERYQALQSRFETTEARAEKASDQVALWQGVAALFIVVAGFALIYGAALGSQARRINFIPGENSTDEAAHEIAL